MNILEFGKINFGVGEYIGMINEGKAHGYGRITFNNGDIYLGEFRDNSMTGMGAKSTSTYHTIGCFQNGKRTGVACTFFKNNKEKYIGEYKNDVENGEGAYLYHNDDLFMGTFAGGLPNGQGCYSCDSDLASGYLLQGYFSNGKYTGNGTKYNKITFGDGSSYCGANDFGERLEAFPKEVRRIGHHSIGTYGYNDMRYKGVKIIGRRSYLDKTMIMNNGCYAKIKDEGKMFVGESSGYGILAEFDNRSIYRFYIGSLSEGDTKCRNGAEVTRMSLVACKGSYEFGKLADGFECYENGLYVKKTRLLYGKVISEEREFPLSCYQGTLNGGSVFVGQSAPRSRPLPKAEASSAGSSKAANTAASRLEIDFGGTMAAPKGIGSNSSSLNRFSSTPPAVTPTAEVKPQIKAEKKSGKLSGAVMALVSKFKKDEPAVEQKPKKRARESYVRTVDPRLEALYREYGFLQSSGRTVLKTVKSKYEKHEIPPEVKFVMSTAFAGNKQVKEVIFKPESTIKLEAGAFADCINLEKIDFSAVKLSDAVGIFPYDAFSGCVNLKTVILPNTEGATAQSKRIVEEDAFLNCDEVKFVDKFLKKTYSKEEFLKEYLSPKKVLTQEERAEREKNKEINEKINEIKSEKGFELKNKDGVIVLVKSSKRTDRIEVPEGIEKIAKSAFSKAREKLTEIVFPSTLREIEGGTFSNFQKLERVDFSKTEITVFPKELFYNCIKLKNVIFPKGLEAIGNGAFIACCGIVKLELPCVKNIAYKAFDGCRSLVEAFIPNAQMIDALAFGFCPALKKIVVGKDISGIHINSFGYDMEKTVVRKGKYKEITPSYRKSAFSGWLNDRKWKKETKRKD